MVVFTRTHPSCSNAKPLARAPSSHRFVSANARELRETFFKTCRTLGNGGGVLSVGNMSVSRPCNGRTGMAWRFATECNITLYALTLAFTKSFKRSPNGGISRTATVA